MELIRLKLLGRLELRLTSGEIHELPTRKSEALLAYLALEPDKLHSRERLANLLWSNRSDEQARNSLRHALSALKKAFDGLNPFPIQIERTSVSVVNDSIKVDALELERLVKQNDPASLVQAPTLYRGEFLESMVIKDPACEEWLLAERNRYCRMAVDAFANLLTHQHEMGEIDAAIDTGEQLVGLDPLREDTWRELMQAYSVRGERNQALKAYQRCCEVLANELGVEPETQTIELDAAIRNGGIDKAPSIPQSGSSKSITRQVSETPPDLIQLTSSNTPSIAVLPFDNLSGDPEQEYFSDGITEDIIRALSRVSGLLVVARHSTMIYKNKAVDLKQVGKEQGVRYVLEGSVRKSGNQIRVSAQLIDTATGHHLWVEHYDRKLGYIFDVQDEITKQVTTELNVRLARGEEARVWARGTSNIEAWDKIVKAAPLTDDHVKEHNVEAQRLAEEAITLDPNYPMGWVILGWTHWEEALWSWSQSKEISIKKAQACAEKAIELDEDNPDALIFFSTIHFTNKNIEEAIELGKKSISLSPNHAGNAALSAMTLIFSGHTKEGLVLIKRAMRLSPIYPAWYLLLVGVVHHMTGDQKNAIAVFRKCIAMEPESSLSRIWLASALIEAGDSEEASKITHEVLEIDPGFSSISWVDDFSRSDDLNNLLLTNLPKAGLPE